MDFQALPVLPIVDFTKENLEPGTSSWLTASNEVRHALEEYGCFFVVYDRVSTALSKDVFGAIQELFDLPVESKVKNVSGKPYFDYIGQMPIIPLHESMGIRDSTTVEGIECFTKLMFPSGNEHFRETMHSFAKLLSELEKMVKKMVFESYGVEKLYDSHIESTTYLLRLIKYRVPQKKETNIGAQCHTDKSFLTILHQNQVNGLEVRTKDGQWITTEFPPSSYLVMAGDAFLAWSNDRVHSAFHRVVISGKEERYSVGLFSYVNGITQIPEELVDDEHPRRFQPFDHFKALDSFAKVMASQSILWCDQPLLN